MSASATPPPPRRVTLAEPREAGKAARDANARGSGRTTWAAEDWDITADVTARLLRFAGLPGPDLSQDDG